MLLETIRTVRTELVIVNLSHALEVCMFFWFIAYNLFQYNSYSIFGLSVSPSIKDMHSVLSPRGKEMLRTCLLWKWTWGAQSFPPVFLTAGYFPFSFFFLEEVTPPPQHGCSYTPAALIPPLLSHWRNRNSSDTSRGKTEGKIKGREKNEWINNSGKGWILEQSSACALGNVRLY